jgi:regulator of replication initiation timing
MTKQEIEFRDPVVQSVVNKFVDRSDVGFAKYGKTLRDDNSDVFEWLNHLQEELMDATLYLQRLKEEITNLREEKALLRELNDIDVIDAFEVKVKKKKKNLKERPGRGDNTGIKKFPSVNDPVIRYYHGLGRDLCYTVEIDD